jgi:hypothetical protein
MFYHNGENCIRDVIVSVLASNAVDRGFELSGQTKDYKLVFVGSPLSTQHYGVRAKTVWLGISLSGAICLMEKRKFTDNFLIYIKIIQVLQ